MTKDTKPQHSESQRQYSYKWFAHKDKGEDDEEEKKTWPLSQLGALGWTE